MLNFLLFSLLLMVDAGPIVGGNVCNEGTEWQCECTRCWEQFEEIPGLEWIRLGLDECSKVNASRLGEKLAGWLNEECASFVSCALSLPIASSQILIGHWGCEKKSTEIRVLLLKNRHGNLSSTGSTAPSWLLGQVLRSRQHLLSFLLHAGLQSIDVYQQSSILTTTSTIVTPKVRTSTQIREIAKSTFVLLSVTVILLLLIFCLLSLYCTQNIVQWTRVVKGRWRHKTYRKVAVNRNSTVDSANE